ncbi:MAG TPA: outer membrane lipoprotein chaperone LolA [Methylophaga sp.]|nr:outer membrane lipoprotein chaperone LolA [Methylophaga sp.]
MLKRWSLMLAGLLSLSVWSVQAEEDAVSRLNQFVAEVNEFQAVFTQTILDSEGNVIEEAEGEFFLSRPGKFRWNYVTPYAQQIVADGQRIWFYDEDLEQITVKNQDETLADTPAGLLSGKSMPEEAYNITAVDKDDDLQWVKLTPKDTESNFQQVQLAFDETGLQQMLMTDAFGQQTKLQFTEVKVNPSLSADRFDFIPPAGVDVVGDAP